MTSLNLSVPARTMLPASAFPASADIYLCDKCERDVTRHLYRGHAHAWTPMGPEFYQCQCGENFPTGNVEWIHLSERERNRRIGQILGIGIFGSVIFSIAGLVAYFVLHRTRGALVAALVIPGLPFFVSSMVFWSEVAASVWRTRIGARITPE